jgi:C4-dicarboxylate-binding protein DctP
VVDGTENPVSNFWTQGMNEVQSDLSLTDHGYLGYAVVTHHRLWRSLSVSDRNLISHAMQSALVFANEIADQQNDIALAALRMAGTTRIHSVSADQRAKLRQAVRPVIHHLEARLGNSWLNELRQAHQVFG